MESEETVRLESPAQWKAVSHPLRLGILRLLQDEGPRTNEELAKSLGVASGNLYFHTKKLEAAGLIKAAGTRPKGHLTEKLYGIVARHLVAADPVKGGKTPPLEPFIAAGLELYRNTWQATGGLPDQVEGGFHLVVPQTPERRRQFVERLTVLAREFRETAAADDDPNTETLALTVLLHTIPVPNRNDSATSGEDTGEDK